MPSTLNMVFEGIPDGAQKTRIIDPDLNVVVFIGLITWTAGTATYAYSGDPDYILYYYALDDTNAALQIGVTE